MCINYKKMFNHHNYSNISNYAPYSEYNINNSNSKEENIIQNFIKMKKFQNKNYSRSSKSAKIITSEDIYRKKINSFNEIPTEEKNQISSVYNHFDNSESKNDHIQELNIELNKANRIISNKNNIIQEYRDILEQSKAKIQIIINKNIQMIKENENLKNQINNKDKEIDELKKIIDELRNEKGRNIKKNNNGNTLKLYKKKNNIKTEPKIYSPMDMKKSIQNKYNMEPLDYTFYLLENIKNNISHIEK